MEWMDITQWQNRSLQNASLPLESQVSGILLECRVCSPAHKLLCSFTVLCFRARFHSIPWISPHRSAHPIPMLVLIFLPPKRPADILQQRLLLLRRDEVRNNHNVRTVFPSSFSTAHQSVLARIPTVLRSTYTLVKTDLSMQGLWYCSSWFLEQRQRYLRGGLTAADCMEIAEQNFQGIAQSSVPVERKHLQLVNKRDTSATLQ